MAQRTSTHLHCHYHIVGCIVMMMMMHGNGDDKVAHLNVQYDRLNVAKEYITRELERG